MKPHAGLWIDHRKAVVVMVTDEGHTTKLVQSNVGPHVRYSGGSGPDGSREGTGEDTRERHYQGELRRYYDEVIALLHEAEAIFIFGPGEARSELKARLEHEGLGARVVGNQPADKMTGQQIVANVRAHFDKQGHFTARR